MQHYVYSNNNDKQQMNAQRNLNKNLFVHSPFFSLKKHCFPEVMMF